MRFLRSGNASPLRCRSILRVRAEAERLQDDAEESLSRPSARTSTLRDLEWVGMEETTRLVALLTSKEGRRSASLWLGEAYDDEPADGNSP